MRDPKFFCCDLLLSLLSTQLYHDSSVNNYSSEHDLFLSHMYSRAEAELRAALHTGSGKLFSESLSVQLVRGLVINATYEVGQPVVTGTARHSSTTLLNHLVKVFGRKPSTRAPSDIAGASAAVLQQTFFGM